MILHKVSYVNEFNEENVLHGYLCFFMKVNINISNIDFNISLFVRHTLLKCVQKKVDWEKYHNRHSSKSI